MIPVKDKCRAFQPAGYVRMALSITVPLLDANMQLSCRRMVESFARRLL